MTKVVLSFRRCLVTMLLACAIAGIAWAQEAKEGMGFLQVTQTDSVQVQFPVTDQPVISLDNTMVTITSGSNNYSAEAADILDFKFIEVDYEAGVVAPLLTQESIKLLNGQILVKGLDSNSRVCLYTAAGIIYGTYTPSDGTVAIQLDGIPSGIYILSTGSTSYKIKK